MSAVVPTEAEWPEDRCRRCSARTMGDYCVWCRNEAASGDDRGMGQRGGLGDIPRQPVTPSGTATGSAEPRAVGAHRKAEGRIGSFQQTGGAADEAVPPPPPAHWTAIGGDDRTHAQTPVAHQSLREGPRDEREAPVATSDDPEWGDPPLVRPWRIMAVIGVIMLFTALAGGAITLKLTATNPTVVGGSDQAHTAIDRDLSVDPSTWPSTGSGSPLRW